MRKRINLQIRNAILQRIATNQQYNTRSAINTLSTQFHVPKQVISGNISWIVRSGAANIARNKPFSYLY
jgi:hypothetical protein